jgi:hypothetical protein
MAYFSESMSSPCHIPIAPSLRDVQSKEILKKKHHLKLHIGVQRGMSKVVEDNLVSFNK